MKRSILIGFGALLVATPLIAEDSASVRMRNTTIHGDRPTPEVFFILPTGKGSRIRSPHRRDYRSEILEPVVKPWLEKDDDVSLARVEKISRTRGEWSDALDEAIEPLPEPEPRAERREPIAEERYELGSERSPPDLDIPRAARSSRPSAVEVPTRGSMRVWRDAPDAPSELDEEPLILVPR